MGVICVSDLIDALEAIKDAIDYSTGQLSAMAACVCATAQYTKDLTARLPDLSGYVDEGLATYTDPEGSIATFTPPGTDEGICELAQAIYAYVWDLYTEVLLPLAGDTADALTAAIIATSTFAGVASFVGLPVAILADIVAVFINWQIDGSIANFENWLYTNKDEIVCVLYSNLPDLDAASQAMSAYIDSVEEISFLDRALLKTVLASKWHYSYIIADQLDNGTWDDDIVAGYCSVCIEYDPQCNIISRCDISDWTVQYPANFACYGGYPYVTGGWMKYLLSNVVQPAADFELEITWYALGDSGNADIACNLISRDTSTQINCSTQTGFPVGAEYVTTWTLNSPGTIGEILDLQSVQAGWYSVIKAFCIRPVT